MPTVDYTNTASSHTLKGTRTTFTNSTGKAVTLHFADGTSVSIDDGADAADQSKTIDYIRYNATSYYSGKGNNVIIPAGNPATIAFHAPNLDVTY